MVSQEQSLTHLVTGGFRAYAIAEIRCTTEHEEDSRGTGSQAASGSVVPMSTPEQSTNNARRPSGKLPCTHISCHAKILSTSCPRAGMTWPAPAGSDGSVYAEEGSRRKLLIQFASFCISRTLSSCSELLGRSSSHCFLRPLQRYHLCLIGCTHVRLAPPPRE